jgi:hypothetical protein
LRFLSTALQLSLFQYTLSFCAENLPPPDDGRRPPAMKPEENLESLRNLGPQSCRWLREVGIHTTSQLRQIGPIGAFQLVRRKSPRTSINLLWAIAAALADIDWRKLTTDTKQQLRKDADLE